VSTKKGTTPDTRTNISISTGLSDLTRKPEDIGYASTAEFFDVMDRARINTYGADAGGFDPDAHVIPSNFLLYPNVTGLPRSEALSNNTNWYDEVMQIGKTTDINASASAQKDKMNFYVSMNYRNEKGVVKSNDFERLSGLVNLDFNLTKSLVVETKVNLSYISTNGAPNGQVALGRGTESTSAGGFAGMIDGGMPWMPAYNDDGTYWNPTSPNLAMLADPLYRRSQQDRYRALMGIAMEYTVPGVDGLKIRATASNDITYSHYIGYMHQALNTRGVSVANDNSYFTKDLVSNIYALFNRSFGKHSFNISTGFETQQVSGFSSEVAGEEIVGQYMQVGKPNNITGFFVGAKANNEHNLIGYFGRASYNYDSRYLLSLSMRRDGSSRFSEKNRWELFPALGLGWVPSSEQFWNISFIDFLKLRGSFGKTGNQNIPDVTVDNYSNTIANRYGDNVSGGTQLTVVGSDVTWEVTNATDLGADFKMFDNRINASIGYYRQDISRLLLAVPIPNSAGYTQLWSNIGDMTNQGWEFSLNTVNVRTNDFSWETNFNLTTNANEVTKLSPNLDDGGKGIIVGRNVTRTGSELGMFYVAEFAGINPDNGIEQVYQVDQEHYQETGETVFAMENGAPKKIPATPANIRNNRYIQDGKSGLPAYFGGFENTFRYKQFDMSFMLYFQGGNYILDLAEQVQSYPDHTHNVRVSAITNTWSEDNRDAKWPELRYSFIFDNYDNDWNLQEGKTNNHDRILPDNLTSRFLHKGDYARLKNLQFGYNLPKQFINKLNINSVRIYLQGTNLFTVSGYKGYDPDITGTSGGADQGINLTQGYVPRNVPVPAVKTYSVGINVQF
jgi:TonB-linked SusC/RagA family outer membrane protein